MKPPEAGGPNPGIDLIDGLYITLCHVGLNCSLRLSDLLRDPENNTTESERQFPPSNWQQKLSIPWRHRRFRQDTRELMRKNCDA